MKGTGEGAGLCDLAAPLAHEPWVAQIREKVMKGVGERAAVNLAAGCEAQASARADMHIPLQWFTCTQVVGTGPDTPPPMQSHGMAVQGSLVSQLGSLELFHQGNSRTAQITEQHEV